MEVQAVFNEEANCHVIEYPAILRSLPASADRELNNANKTPYGWATAEVDYPDGKDVIFAIVWGTNLTKGTYDELIDKAVKLRINVDGDFPGLTTLQLAGSRFNLGRLSVKMPSSEKAPEVTT
jgi:hypothetical protein